MSIKIKRFLLKLSGEAFIGKKKFGIDPNIVVSISKQIKEVKELGCEIAIVIGGGNIFRGNKIELEGLDRSTADYMGMLGTVINALALQNGLEKEGVPTRVQSAIPINSVCEPFIRRKSIRHLEKGRIIIFAGGTGNPYFTTDTAAVLRSVEMDVELVMKATKVDGIYEEDPLKNKNAKFYNEISYKQVLEKDIRVMDHTAITLCMENKLPILVFNLLEEGNIKKAVFGEQLGTYVSKNGKR